MAVTVADGHVTVPVADRAVLSVDQAAPLISIAVLPVKYSCASSRYSGSSSLYLKV